MKKNMIKKIEEIIAKSNAKTDKEKARLSHTITMAVGQGTEIPVKSAEWALNRNDAVMYRIETVAHPTPIFVNIQNNFLKKNTPEEEEKTGKKNVVVKELSVYNFNKLVENYFSIKDSKDPEFAINTIANNTNYIFFREMIENLDIISKNFNINLTESNRLLYRCMKLLCMRHKAFLRYQVSYKWEAVFVSDRDSHDFVCIFICKRN